MKSPLCGYENQNRKPYYNEMQELFGQTPMEVWRGYAENGYGWAQMILEEFSHQ